MFTRAVYQRAQQLSLLLCALLLNSAAYAEQSINVNVLNYVNAKSSVHFDRVLSRGTSFNNWLHNRSLVPITEKPQGSRRVNRDTLYSYALVNISEGASFTLPDSDGRYLSVQVINQDHYTNRTYYKPGEHKLSMAKFDTPYVLLLARVLVDASDPQDWVKAHELQDKLKVNSQSDTPYVSANFDAQSLKDVTKTLLSLADALPDARYCFGQKGEVDAVRHLLATAYGWGGLPDADAIYQNVQPNLPIGEYSLKVQDVPVDGFWSVSVYNRDGYFEKNQRELYSINNLTAVPNVDGSYTIRFGGDETQSNYLPITDGWNYVVRMYRPKKEVIDGSWEFPMVE